ncbi:hypothetical protein ACFE04_027060 [Oxalis oulophora]
MLSWWGKSSSKETNKKQSKESFIDALQRRFKTQSEKLNARTSGSHRRNSHKVLEKGCQSQVQSRSGSPVKKVSRCQSFSVGPSAQPLPLPGPRPAIVAPTDSEVICISPKPKVEKSFKSSLFLPLPRPACIRSSHNTLEFDGDVVIASVSSEISSDSDEPADSRCRNLQGNSYDKEAKATASTPSSRVLKEQLSKVSQTNSVEGEKSPGISFSNQISATSSPRRRPLGGHVPNLQVPYYGNFFTPPESSKSSPSRSPINAFGVDQVMNFAYGTGKPYSDVTFLGSGQCSSPGSGPNSGHNSMGGDMLGQLFWQQSRSSPEYSPIPSPRMTSPGPSSRIQSGAVTPIHPRAGGTLLEQQINWLDDGKQQSHRLPLPPGTISGFPHSNSAATSPSVPRSPGRVENPPSPTSRWKKGKLLGRGTFGHVYVGFNSESGEMCAMKEVTLFADDAKSKESAKQLMQEINLLSRLRHPNIVQYYESEKIDDRLYIYLEYVSGGSIYKLLQEYGALGEAALRSYTHQILSGLAFLHSKSTVHRDIKGANILVDPNGRVKLADFGMAKHITGQSCPLSFKGSPYWMAPEVIKNASGCNLAVDIWSLGCTVLEMATTKPPWSQYEGVAAMFKIGNSKELPVIPDNLSDEGKDFVRKCLQRNPMHRPSAAQLLEHPFVKYAAPLERPIPSHEPLDPQPDFPNGVSTLGIGQVRNFGALDSDRLAVHSSRVSRNRPCVSDIQIPRNISCPVSPIGSPLLRSRSPQQHMNGRLSPSPISSPRTTSGSSTPLSGGSCNVPFNHLGGRPKPSNNIYVNGPTYHHDMNPDIFRGLKAGSIFSEAVHSENDGQSVLVDCVFRQLLGDRVKMKPSLDLSPKSPLPKSRTSGI